MKYATFIKQSNLVFKGLQKTQNTVSQIINSESFSDYDKEKLKLHALSVKQKLDDFKVNLTKVLSVHPLPTEFDDDAVSDYESKISELCYDILATINAACPSEDKPVAQLDVSIQAAGSSISPTLTQKTNVNLPKIQLKTFNGQPQHWITFYNLFDTLVNKNESLSDIERFQYLLSVLQGPALDLIKSLPISQTNYNIAWRSLVKRYHNTRLLSSMHINAILDLPNVTKPNCATLRNFILALTENMQALLALECNIKGESLLLTTVILRKFDLDYRNKFEHSRVNSLDMPTIEELIQFLERECTRLEAAHLSDSPKINLAANFSKNDKFQTLRNYNSQSRISSPQKHILLTTSNVSCFYCNNSSHNIYKCDKFSNLSPQDRFNFIKSKRYCINCLGTQHSVSRCQSQRTCSTCQQKHHSLLHLSSNKSFLTTSSSNANKSRFERPSNSAQDENIIDDAPLVATSTVATPTVLLATTLVHIKASNGNSIVTRAILDSAAQATFISEYVAQALKINRYFTSSYINGVSASKIRTKGMTSVTLSSLSGQILASKHQVIILDKITGNMPCAPLSNNLRQQLKHLTLADPTFDTPAPVDVLIGADLFAKTLLGKSVSLGENSPTAILTIFGYTIVGTTSEYISTQSQGCNGLITLLTTQDMELHSSLQRFWTIEEPPSLGLTPDEQQCETHFQNTHSRDSSGRYVVSLPFKHKSTLLGDSSCLASKMFRTLERRFIHDPQFKKAYVEFMRDYIHSGHMNPRVSPVNSEKPHYFLPHHGVMRNNKIRVVFNASANTTSGLSLNSILHAGQKLQNDIPDIISRFRHFEIVFTCDIRQMFRQILINTEDRQYQLIFWREDSSQPLEIYELATVTYGMASSPYLANRVIQQLIAVEGHNYPMATRALKGQIFVDDCLLGHNSIEEALQLRQEVISLMSKGGFELRKWSTNTPQILDDLPDDHQETPILFGDSQTPVFNILGLKWISTSDCFSYQIKLPESSVTKRSILSAIARNYDPMGWLSPVIIWAKSLLQQIWTLGVDWDSPLPSEIIQKWNAFVKDLPSLEAIRIPRHLGYHLATNIQLHGFCDASEAGYAAVVYLRIQDSVHNFSTRLIISKSKVSPLKRISLPRLELCGAHLLAKLLKYCISTLSPLCKINETHAWCDSTIVLSWINTSPFKLKTYVANRISEIQELVPVFIWHHVSSAQNPADCASRGISPTILVNHSLWWNGPDWLLESQPSWPTPVFSPVPLQTLPEIRTESLNVFVVTPASNDLLLKFSSWETLTRILAYILRFHHNVTHSEKLKDCITSQELKSAITRICKLVQAECFSKEILSLQKGNTTSTRIQNLNPFIDNDGLIRVGGRLVNSHLNYSSKHPVLLPKKHHIVTLLVNLYHLKYLHAGPQILQSLISQQFWILSARSCIRQIVFKCIRCYRCRPVMPTPLMGDLPAQRVEPCRAFKATGVDYAGPFQAKVHLLKRMQPIKVYLCLFICFATKAVHLEMVTDLTAEGYIAALSRFIARRGIPSDFYSDCGTNFIGASSILRKQFTQLIKTSQFSKFFSSRSINFHFIPPRAPHHGGLWERAVRSVKHHLRRVIGDQILTMEEFNTLLTQVEAILNSRPLTPLSSDPSEFEALTPGHFLIGEPLLALPRPDVTDVPNNRLRRWHLIQKFSQLIWSRWQKEYLSTLHQRSKWVKPQKNLEVGSLVIIHADNTPPLYWKLGRIIEINPGTDGIVRVVKLKTPEGVITRPVVKVSPLPVS